MVADDPTLERLPVSPEAPSAPIIAWALISEEDAVVFDVRPNFGGSESLYERLAESHTRIQKRLFRATALVEESRVRALESALSVATANLKASRGFAAKQVEMGDLARLNETNLARELAAERTRREESESALAEARREQAKLEDVLGLQTGRIAELKQEAAESRGRVAELQEAQKKWGDTAYLARIMVRQHYFCLGHAEPEISTIPLMQELEQFAALRSPPSSTEPAPTNTQHETAE